MPWLTAGFLAALLVGNEGKLPGPAALVIVLFYERRRPAASLTAARSDHGRAQFTWARSRSCTRRSLSDEVRRKADWRVSVAPDTQAPARWLRAPTRLGTSALVRGPVVRPVRLRCAVLSSRGTYLPASPSIAAGMRCLPTQAYERCTSTRARCGHAPRRVWGPELRVLGEPFTPRRSAYLVSRWGPYGLRSVDRRVGLAPLGSRNECVARVAPLRCGVSECCTFCIRPIGGGWPGWSSRRTRVMVPTRELASS